MLIRALASHIAAVQLPGQNMSSVGAIQTVLTTFVGRLSGTFTSSHVIAMSQTATRLTLS